MKKFSSLGFTFISIFMLCSNHFECKKNIYDYNPIQSKNFPTLSKHIINNYVFFTERLQNIKHLYSRIIYKVNDPFLFLFDLKKYDFIFHETYLSKCSHEYHYRNILKSKAHPPTS